ncbi:MAG: hypothetical protein NT163_07550 [Chlorobiales bacterium]|nr:hypothetical protein [Chlorobiales bacterium]
MKLSKKYLAALLFGLMVQNPSVLKAADGSSPTYLPNNYGKSLTTPVAWGASNNVIFVGVGGTTPAQYTHGTDGAAVFGAGIGDPVKNLGVQLSIVSLDVSEWKEYSASLHLFRDLGNANAFGVGVENVMLTNGGDAGKSFYAVYSQGVQSDPFVDKNSGNSKLTYSVGVGSGRFGDKSPLDISSGKGAHGTYAFGNIAYDIADSFNVIADWNGLNLNAGASKTFWVGNLPLAVVVGAADLTHNSGDGVRLIAAVGTGFKF